MPDPTDEQIIESFEMLVSMRQQGLISYATYAKHMKAYTEAVGVDTDAVMREYETIFPNFNDGIEKLLSADVEGT